MRLLADKIKGQMAQLGPRDAQLYSAVGGEGLLLVSRSAGSCIEIRQTGWYPLCRWALAEYRPGQAPASHVVDCEWAILTWLQTRWLASAAAQSRGNRR